MNMKRILAAAASLALVNSLSVLPVITAAEEEPAPVVAVTDPTVVTPVVVPENSSQSVQDEMVSRLNRVGLAVTNIITNGGSEEDEIAYGDELGEYTVNTPAAFSAPEQKQFDLRNVNGKNYVTPVKNQDPFATCWAFAACAAAESSIAYELGIDLNTADAETQAALDFSERHFVWFTESRLPENTFYPAQAGEGMRVYSVSEMNPGLYASDPDYSRDYNNKLFNAGGSVISAIPVYYSGQGPAPEAEVPYHNEENTYEGCLYVLNFTGNPNRPIPDFETLYEYVTPDSLTPIYYHSEDELSDYFEQAEGSFYYNSEDWYMGPGKYILIDSSLMAAKGGDWSVSEEKRFTGTFDLECVNCLPSPAGVGADGGYHFDENGLNAFKSEIANGRAVTVSFLSDRSRPGQEAQPGNFIQFLDKDGHTAWYDEAAVYWCHYTYDTTYELNGINKKPSTNHEATIIGYDDSFPKEYFYDPNGTIGGDGAFIVKNSWGDGWGDQGYFYLSYYDQSLSYGVSFDFDVQPGQKVSESKKSTAKTYMHDFMTSINYGEQQYTEKASMANVFTAEEDTVLTTVGYTAITCNENVSYEVYLLNDDAKNPTDGVLAASESAQYTFAGAQKTNLKAPVALKKGQRFSVVVTAKRENGQYGIGIKLETSEKGCENIEELLWINGIAYGIVNPGESYLGVNEEWADWADIVAKTHEDAQGQNLSYDNFCIRAFTDTAASAAMLSEPAIGDVNRDGLINASDATMILIASAHIGSGDPTGGLNETEQSAADVNQDSLINAIDATIVLRYAAAIGAGRDVKLTDFV